VIYIYINSCGDHPYNQLTDGGICVVLDACIMCGVFSAFIRGTLLACLTLDTNYGDVYYPYRQLVGVDIHSSCQFGAMTGATRLVYKHCSSCFSSSIHKSPCKNDSIEYELWSQRVTFIELYL
jgi:hypothetical protein